MSFPSGELKRNGFKSCHFHILALSHTILYITSISLSVKQRQHFVGIEIDNVWKIHSTYGQFLLLAAVIFLTLTSEYWTIPGGNIGFGAYESVVTTFLTINT